MSPSSEAVMAVYDEWEAANAKVAGLSLDALTHAELLGSQHRREVVVRSLPTVDHQIINRLAAEADPKALGSTSLADVLATKLGISKVEARRRIKLAELLGPRQTITGEPLAPKLAHTAAAQARGQIGPEHVRVIEKFFENLPNCIDAGLATRPKQTSRGSQKVWGRRSSAPPPTGWRCCSTRTASHPMRPSGPGGGI
jgi:hypothetical protein